MSENEKITNFSVGHRPIWLRRNPFFGDYCRKTATKSIYQINFHTCRTHLVCSKTINCHFAVVHLLSADRFSRFNVVRFFNVVYFNGTCVFLFFYFNVTPYVLMWLIYIWLLFIWYHKTIFLSSV